MNEQALTLAVGFIKPWEGLCLRSYPDPASPLSKALSARNILAKYKRGEVVIPTDLRSLSGTPWTLGYGETRGITEDMAWTLEQAESRLRVRVAEFMAGVLKASPKLSTQAPDLLAACTSLAYNVGLGGYRGSTVAKRIALEDWQGAADAILMWNKAGGQVVQGLVNRRKAEREMFLKGVGKVVVPETQPPVIVEEKKKGGSLMEKLWALLELFKKGKAVADPAKWKARQITGTMIGVLIITAVQVARVFGYDLPYSIDEGVAETIGGVVVGITNIIFTFITSKRVGVTEQVDTSVQPADEFEESHDVQNITVSDMATTITTAAAGIEAWLDAAHTTPTVSATADQRRTEDQGYFGT